MLFGQNVNFPHPVQIVVENMRYYIWYTPKNRRLWENMVRFHAYLRIFPHKMQVIPFDFSTFSTDFSTEKKMKKGVKCRIQGFSTLRTVFSWQKISTFDFYAAVFHIFHRFFHIRCHFKYFRMVQNTQHLRAVGAKTAVREKFSTGEKENMKAERTTSLFIHFRNIKNRKERVLLWKRNTR